MSLNKIVLLANENARGKSRKGVMAANEILSKHVTTEVVFTKSIEEARIAASVSGDNPDNIVVACGGDGTVNEIANALPPQGVLGIIPAGTANVIAKELGIPLSYREAAKTLLTSAIKTIDVGVANGRKFIFVAGIGFDAHVAAKVSPFLKRKIGKYAFHIAGLKEFITYKAPKIEVSVDDKPYIKGRFGIFANMRRYGGDFFFAKNARYDDGILDMVLLPDIGTIRMMKVLGYAKKNKSIPNSSAIQISGKKFKVKISPSSFYQLDGEVVDEVEGLDIEVLPQNLNVMVP